MTKHFEFLQNIFTNNTFRDILNYGEKMPTVLIIGNIRFFFNSREETRRHIHVETPDGIAKFWLEPFVSLSTSYNLSEIELNRIESITKERRDDFIEEWNRHFRI